MATEINVCQQDLAKKTLSYNLSAPVRAYSTITEKLAKHDMHFLRQLALLTFKQN